MGWDVQKMDRSVLFTRVLQPVVGRFMDALDKITGGRLDETVARADMHRSMGGRTR
jgi:hypothetical protein